MRRDEIHAMLFLLYALAWALIMVNMPAIFRAFGLI